MVRSKQIFILLEECEEENSPPLKHKAYQNIEKSKESELKIDKMNQLKTLTNDNKR